MKKIAFVCSCLTLSSAVWAEKMSLPAHLHNKWQSVNETISPEDLAADKTPLTMAPPMRLNGEINQPTLSEEWFSIQRLRHNWVKYVTKMRQRFKKNGFAMQGKPKQISPTVTEVVVKEDEREYRLHVSPAPGENQWRIGVLDEQRQWQRVENTQALVKAFTGN